MNQKKLHDLRLRRIKQAVALEKPDRVPVVLEYSCFAPFITQTSVYQFLKSPETTLETMIKAYHMIGEGDAVNYGIFWVYGLCYDYMSKVYVPGIDLPENEIWQVIEKELMTTKDYDQILKTGWPDFFNEFMQKRILNNAPADLLPPKWKPGDVRQKWAELGIPILSGGDVTTPFEVLCGSRTLVNFAIDLVEIPNKIEAVMDAIVPHLANRTIQKAIKSGYPGIWIGGWRSAPALFSPKMWNRFVWPYFKRLVEEVINSGLIAILHLDSNWTRELKRFRELPKGKCIMSLDGETDLFQAKQILGDHMCLMGDVPASMLYLETPDKVYEYCSKLIMELGPEGFILQSGCDIPANAKLENVKAMVTAALEA